MLRATASDCVVTGTETGQNLIILSDWVMTRFKASTQTLTYHTKIKTIVDYNASKVTARYRLHIKLKKGQKFVQEFASDSVLQYESPLSKTEASASPGKEQTALWCALEKVIQKQLRTNVSDVNS